jgi:hypothetical protein
MKQLFVTFALLAAVESIVITQTGPTSLSDPAFVQGLLKQHDVPGVSIAVIKDFKVASEGLMGPSS